MSELPEQLDLFWLEELLWLATTKIDLPSYDFPFETYFALRRPLYRDSPLIAVARCGAIADYEKFYAALLEDGVRLLHTPEQHNLAADLTHWYPRLEGLTPRSAWFASLPSPEEIEALFSYPVFVKGSRQTNRHRAALSIIRSRNECAAMLEAYRRDPVLHWQALVCREFVPLRAVGAARDDKIPPSFEFRVFFWKGEMVGAGPYWSAFSDYSWTPLEQAAALELAAEAARRVDVPFLVVDVAQTQAGEWTVIECNDAQESGYAGVNALGLWQRILEIERQT